MCSGLLTGTKEYVDIGCLICTLADVEQSARYPLPLPHAPSWELRWARTNMRATSSQAALNCRTRRGVNGSSSNTRPRRRLHQQTAEPYASIDPMHLLCSHSPSLVARRALSHTHQERVCVKNISYTVRRTCMCGRITCGSYCA